MTKRYIRFPNWSILRSFAGGSLRLHRFHQGEPEIDAFHDHEYDFWTFPLHSYLEGVLEDDGHVSEQVVPGWRITRRQRYGFHVVYGAWEPNGHPAEDTPDGVINKYKGFWTILLGKGMDRDFSIVRFEHPTLDYSDWCEEHPEGDPRPFWRRHQFNPKTGEAPGVPHYPEAYARFARGEQ